MISSPSAAGTGPSFSRYVEELHEFFAGHGVPFGSPEDIAGLADRVSTPGLFESEMASMVRSIILREGGNPSIADLLGIVAVAIGGPKIEERAPDFSEPLHRIVKFLGLAFRTRWGAIPEELSFDERQAAAAPAPMQWAEPKQWAEPMVAAPQPSAGDPPAEPVYAIPAKRGISAAHAFSAARDISRAQAQPEVLAAAEPEVLPEPAAGLEPLGHPAGGVAAESASAAVIETPTSVEAVQEPASVVAAQVVAELEVAVQSTDAEAVPETGDEAVAKPDASDAETGLEPLPHAAAGVSNALGTGGEKVPAVPERAVATTDADVADRGPGLPRFLETALAERQALEARPWMRRRAGWLVAAVCAVAAGAGGGMWAYQRQVEQAAWVNEHLRSVAAPPAVVSPAEVTPTPSGPTGDASKLRAAALRAARRGPAGPRSTHPPVRRTPRAANTDDAAVGGATRPLPAETAPTQPPAPVFRASPAAETPAVTPQPATSTGRPATPQT